MDPMTQAIATIDAANGEDPNDYGGVPLALAQGRRAEQWVQRLAAPASDALRVAARAHHLRRWKVPRDTYPQGRAGYLRWRRDQKTRHAAELTEVLETAGVEPATIERATTIVAKRGLGSDPEVQIFEDAVSLTFLETQLRATIDKLADDDRMVEIIAKTLAKMSDAGRARAVALALDDHCRELVGRAVARGTAE